MLTCVVYTAVGTVPTAAKRGGAEWQSAIKLDTFKIELSGHLTDDRKARHRRAACQTED